ncbi:MAG: class I SAM-dependent methyltransferase [Porticoccaceae bacterium]
MTGSRPAHTAWQQWYRRPLVDLGATGGEQLQGIFSPLYEETTVERYIQAQFRADAQTYAERYAAVEYFTALLSDALGRIGWQGDRLAGKAILDIGSGAGNSIFPLLRLCPDALVVASDLSLELLALLKRMLAEQGLDRRCGLLQLNAEELDFAPESFDLVVGAAVLHHLFSPNLVIAGCGRILKPGGAAIFFEPFENGNAVLSLIQQMILEQEDRREPLDPAVKAFLQAQTADQALRRGRDKSSPLFARLDDKWLFTKSFLEELAAHAGFSECRIYPLHSPERQFANQIEVNLRLGLGRNRTALPQWAWSIIQRCDEHFSPDLKRDLLIEGAVLLKK